MHHYQMSGEYDTGVTFTGFVGMISGTFKGILNSSFRQSVQGHHEFDEKQDSLLFLAIPRNSTPRLYALKKEKTGSLEGLYTGIWKHQDSHIQYKFHLDDFVTQLENPFHLAKNDKGGKVTLDFHLRNS